MAKQSLSIRQKLAKWLLSKEQQHKSSTSPDRSYRLYDSLDTLPLSVFRACTEQNDLTGLIIEGVPPIEAVEAMWDKHWADYLDDNSAGELVYLIQLEKELALLKHRADVELDLQMMELPECNDQLFAGLVDCVKGRGFVMYKHYDTLEAKKNAIKRIRNQTAPIKLQIQIKSREYTQYIEAKQAETVPESYITVMLIRLSDWKKYHIDEEKLTVKQFNIRVREYVKYVQENNRTL